MALVPVATADQVQQLLAGPGLTLLDFWQLTCAPCRALEPRLEAVLRRHPDVQAARIDVDSDLQAPSRFDVLSIPTLLLFHGRTEIGRLDGLIREADIDQASPPEKPSCSSGISRLMITAAEDNPIQGTQVLWWSVQTPRAPSAGRTGFQNLLQKVPWSSRSGGHPRRPRSGRTGVAVHVEVVTLEAGLLLAR